MLSNSQTKLIPIKLVLMYILLSPTLALPLNSSNGVNVLYILTVSTFFVPAILAVLATLIKTNRFFGFGVFGILLYVTVTTLPNMHTLINYTKVNAGLFNPLGQYHPPLLFFAVVSGIYYLLSGGGNVRLREIVSTGLLISLVFSGWWANQELFWGNYWNWDPVELSSCLLLCTFVLVIHLSTVRSNWGGVNYSQLALLVCVITYVTNRGPTANSVHQFSDTFFLKIDEMWFWLFWMLLAKLLFIMCYGMLHRFVNEKWKRTDVITIAVLSIIAIILLTEFILLSNRLIHQPKSVAKYALFWLINCTWILSKRVALSIPRTKSHQPAQVVGLTVLFYTEAPVNDLYIDAVVHNMYYTRISNNYTALTAKDSCFNLVRFGEYRTVLKHQTAIPRQLGSTTTTQQYIKHNPTSKFVVFDTNNSTKLAWFLTKRAQFT